MQNSQTPSCFLFDLGGVLIQLADQERALAWAKGQLTAEQADELWKSSPLTKQFECGECSEYEFAALLIEELQLDCDPLELLEEFAEYVIAPFTGARSLLLELKEKGTVACLSNTNSLHWNKVQETMNILDCFDHLFPSHLIKCRKPEPEAFLTVIEQMQTAPPNIVFFDDLASNVEAARACGIKAFQVNGIAQTRETLQKLSVL